MPFSNPSDAEIAAILARTATIALVGWSADPARPSHGVARYLASAGYRVIPVNPGLAGRPALSGSVVASLSDIPADAGVEMVDIFRRSPEVGKVVDEALSCLPGLRVIWTQLGVRDDEAAARAMRAGVAVVQDRCPAIERPRLLGS